MAFVRHPRSIVQGDADHEVVAEMATIKMVYNS